MSATKKHYYLFYFQYLGFRYHGWQKQKDVKTIQQELEKVIAKFMGDAYFRIIASGRTDAMVSVNESAFELFTREPIDAELLMADFELKLPPDIRVLRCEETTAAFNIIQSSKQKEYLYLFSFGERFHPFASPFMTFFLEDLDLELMKKGAKLFEGEHSFRLFSHRISEKSVVVRSVDVCEIVENDVFKANFFPEKSYLLRVKGSGFIRYQIRLMMGTLLKLGMHAIALEDIKKALREEGEEPIGYLAPASGLILNKVTYH